MASINEKIVHSSLCSVNLYKEGVFWTAYEQSAYYVWLLKGYKPSKKRYKKMNKEVCMSSNEFELFRSKNKRVFC